MFLYISSDGGPLTVISIVVFVLGILFQTSFNGQDYFYPAPNYDTAYWDGDALYSEQMWRYDRAVQQRQVAEQAAAEQATAERLARAQVGAADYFIPLAILQFFLSITVVLFPKFYVNRVLRPLLQLLGTALRYLWVMLNHVVQLFSRRRGGPRGNRRPRHDIDDLFDASGELYGEDARPATTSGAGADAAGTALENSWWGRMEQQAVLWWNRLQASANGRTRGSAVKGKRIELIAAKIHKMPTHVFYGEEEMKTWSVSELKEELRKRGHANGKWCEKQELLRALLATEEDENEHAYTHGGSSSALCSVCYCDYEAGDVLRTLPCRHCFHLECIDRWLFTAADYSRPVSCPLCNQAI